MKFSFELTQQDYLDFNIFTVQNYKFYKKNKKSLRLLYALMPLLVALIFSHIIISILMVSLSILFYIYLPKFLYEGTLKNLKNIIYNEGKNNILGKRDIIIQEDEILEIEEHSKSSIMYEKITKLEESDKAVYLFIAPWAAIIFPNRIFSSQEEKMELINFVKTKINSVKYFGKDSI